MSDQWDVIAKPDKKAAPRKSQHEVYIEQLQRKFKTLPKRQKDLIRAAHEDGIEWRGEDTHHKRPQLDDLTHFEHVIREFMRMREDPKSYRERANALRKSVMAR